MQPTSRDTKEFEGAIKEMAAAPEIIAECEAIAREFAALESDRFPEE
jgi:hypothetical protein